VTTWILLRAAGIGAYVMLFLAVTWGLISTTAIVTKRISKPASTMFHQFAAAAGLVLLGTHLGLLLVDRFMSFHALDLLVPMRSTFRPVAITFGVLALYAFAIVMVTSWLRKRLGSPWWRRFHLLAVPAFTLALVHGVFAGTDSPRTWMWSLYASTGVIVLFLVFVRGLTYGYRPARAGAPGPPARAPRPQSEPRIESVLAET
jgi:cytochrome b561